MIGHFGYLETAVRERDAHAMGFPMHWTLLLSRFNSGLDFKRSASSICLFDPARNSNTNPAPEFCSSLTRVPQVLQLIFTRFLSRLSELIRWTRQLNRLLEGREFNDTVAIRIAWTDYEARWPKTAKSLKPTL